MRNRLWRILLMATARSAQVPDARDLIVAIFVLLGVSSLLGAGIGFLLGPFQGIAGGVAVLFLFGCISITRVAYTLLEERDALASALPNVKMLSCRSKLTNWLSYPKGEVLFQLHLANVEFANEPSVLIAAANASGVVAYVEYFDATGKTRVLNMALYGRWEHAPLPASLPVHASLDQLYPADFPVSGVAHILCVALKFPDDDDCYALDNAVMRGGNLRQARYRLIGGTFKIRITLVGARIYREYWLTLHNRGQGAPLEVQC